VARRSVLFCAGALLAFGIWAGGLPYKYRRDLPVAAPGWVRTRVPLEVLGKLGSTGEDFAFVDPSGVPVPLFPWRAPADPPPATRAADLKDMATVPGGWRLEADLGPGPVRHRMLLLEIPGTGLAEGVTLEGSQDEKAWRVLARGSMFRLNRWGMTSKTYLDYAPTADRYLRIFWPESASFPHWKTLWVADWPEDRTEWTEEPVSFTEAWEACGEKAYALAFPKIALDRPVLVLEAPLAYPVRARVLAARDGSWVSLSETVLVPDRPLIVTLPRGAFEAPSCLALGAGEYAPPVPRSMKLRYVPRYFVFKAVQAGTYAFWYGALGRAGRPGALAELPAMPEACAEAALGSEREQPLPDLPAPSLAMGAALPKGPFAGHWAVQAPLAKPGALTRLSVPAGLYAVSREDLGDVRLGASGRQVPYVLWSPPEGVEVVSLRRAAPKPSAETGKSQIDLELPEANLPLVSLELSAPAAPFSREVTLECLRPPAPEEGGRGAVWSVVDRAAWNCPGVSDAPARLGLRAGRLSGTKLRVTFMDGDNAPLPFVDAVLWRRGHALVFPWPESGEVELMAGAQGVYAPRYDLAALSEDIIQRPAALADAGRPAIPPQGALASPNMKWILLVGLILAGIVLIAILARSIRTGEGQEAKE